MSACVFALLSATALAADESEQLEGDFLEYLAHLEGDDDDWTLVAQAEEARAKPSEDADAARKAKAEQSKQADKPAVDER